MKKLQVNNSDASKKFAGQFNIALSKVTSCNWLFLAICRWGFSTFLLGSEDQGNTRYSFKTQSYRSLHIKNKSCSLLVCLRLGTEIFSTVMKWDIYAILCDSDEVTHENSHVWVRLVEELKTGKIRICPSSFWRTLANVHVIIFT